MTQTTQIKKKKRMKEVANKLSKKQLYEKNQKPIPTNKIRPITKQGNPPKLLPFFPSNSHNKIPIKRATRSSAKPVSDPPDSK